MDDSADARDAGLAAALAERLRAQGLARVVDGILLLALPAIRLNLTRVEDEATLPVGASKVGGAPDLPRGATWPATSDGQLLPFIAQIRLADIAALDLEGDLPHVGLLTFFYAMNEADGGLRTEDDPMAWRVLWTQDESTPLARLVTPDARTNALTNALDARFSACAVAFERRLTLPDVGSAAVQRLGFTNDERAGYINVVTGLDIDYLPEMDLHLLGYPYALEPGVFLAAHDAEHGGAPAESAADVQEREERLRALGRMQEVADRWAASAGGYTSQWARMRALFGLLNESQPDDLRRVFSMARPKRTPDNAAQAMAERVRRVDEEWRLLLQVYSNDDAEMDWAGGGVIHFGIKRAALAARDFSQMWVSLQFL